MSTTYTPSISALAATVPEADGYLESPPIWWHAFAGDLNASSVDESDADMLHPAGELQGDTNWDNLSLCFSDVAPNAGERSFSDPHGAWGGYDIFMTSANSYGLNFYRGQAYRKIQATHTTTNDTWDTETPNTEHYLLEDAAWSSAGMLPCYVKMGLSLLRTGLNLGQGGHAAAWHGAGYAALELNYGATDDNLRLWFGSSGEVRLQRWMTNTQSWFTLAKRSNWGKGIGGYNGFYLIPSPRQEHLSVYFGPPPGYAWDDGSMTRKRPIRIGANRATTGKLATIERWRVVMYNAVLNDLEVAVLRYGPARVQSAPRLFAPGVDPSTAQVRVNMLSGGNPDQAVSSTVSGDGQGNLRFDVTASLPDATAYGTNMPTVGSATAPVISDVLVYIPPRWSWNPLGGALSRVSLPVVQMRMLQVWDDAARMGATSGRLLCSNADNWAAGTFGNYSLILTLANGWEWGQVLRGVIGGDPDGVQLMRDDPWRFVEFPFRDFWAKTEVPTGGEYILDGLALPCAIRKIAEAGNIHPTFLQNIPNVDFPPPSGYPDGFPYYILGKGTGLNPKYRFQPDRTAASILQELLQDSGEIVGSAVLPHFAWFDPSGQFRWEAYDPTVRFRPRLYSTNDPTGVGQISAIRVYNSVAQLRSDITLQGQDALTYELLQYHLPLPLNAARLGWRHPWLERNSRYSSLAYMRDIARIAAAQASLPQQVVRMLVPYWPDLQPGDVIPVWDDATLGGTRLFYVTEIDTTLGMAHPGTNDGAMLCQSWVTGRNVESALPAPVPIPVPHPV